MGRVKRMSDGGLPRDLIMEIVGAIPGMLTVDMISDELVVPTMFTSLNRATGVGGWPLRRMGLIHGQNQTGKSVIALGIAESLRRMGHIPMIFDTEHSAEKRWYNELSFGPCTPFKMPESLDEVIDDVQVGLNSLHKKKEGKGATARLLKNVGLCIVIDTMTKLIPSEALEKMRKEGVSRGYSIAAMYTSLWMKSLIPQLYRGNSTLLCVVQERENVDRKGPRDKKYKVTAGQAPQYDTSLRIQTTYAKKVEEGKRLVGYQNFFKLIKNKVDGVEMAEGSFFTSNGKGSVPRGYDMFREAIEEARFREVAKVATKDKVKVVRFEFPGQKPFIVKGGWSDVRDRMMANEAFCARVVDGLNDMVRI